MNIRLIKNVSLGFTAFLVFLSTPHVSFSVTADEFVAVPPFVTSGAPPLVMLVMGRNHKLFYEAYNDASDLDGDDVIDIRYMPDDIDYYGYFDNYKCYEYNDDDGLFEPSSTTTDKTCSGDEEWSGDFLNYITMSRMDTIRKVLYGGYRSTDEEGETILERVYVPQDAHSWGKEYTSEDVDGYDIADYTPLEQPVTVGDTTYRHLFASTSLVTYSNSTIDDYDGGPIMRVAQNTAVRVWEWLSVEGHAAQTDDIETGTLTTSSVTLPEDHDDFEDIVYTYAQDSSTYLYGSGSWMDYDDRNGANEMYSSSSDSGYSQSGGGMNKSQGQGPENSSSSDEDDDDFGAIDGSGNPYGDNYSPYNQNNQNEDEQNYYLAIFEGYITVSASESDGTCADGAICEGTYYFAVDGDEAVEVIITNMTTGEETVTGRYGSNTRAKSAQNGVEVELEAGVTYKIEFRMIEEDGSDSYYLYWKQPDDSSYSIMPISAFDSLTLSTYKTSSSVECTLDDYYAKVKVCDSDIGLEDDCKAYSYTDSEGSTVTGYKPIGLLQRYGETEQMYFGLMSGSWANNISGGVLRKNISSITDEINSDTGIITDEDGIIGTINKFKIQGYGGSSYSCGWMYDGPMDESSANCIDWGNPIAEMMYETVRYFSGKGEPTSEYDGDDTNYDLTKEDWIDPYDTFESCSAPYMLVLSDINPTFDTDDLPGVASQFGSGITTDLDSGNFSVSTQMETITDNEDDIVGNKYIGESGDDADDVCSEKDVTAFGEIRGLCPEEPTKKGGYYAAGIAHYGHETDLNDADDDQNLTTFTVGLASPLPRIELDVGGQHITAVPFAKSVSGSGISNYYPTNTIVDFYVTTLTDTYGKFRINYEDVEQGADHDMDMIVIYEYQLIDDDGEDVDDSADATRVKFTLTSEYAYGGIEQHAGYIISGTTADGMYLEVKDADTTTASSFYLDTPQDDDSNDLLDDDAERIFTPSDDEDSDAAELIENPLWYAAKWGGFNEKDSESSTTYGIPDSTDEWDKDDDGDPDTYFYVTNPTELESQLNKSFAAILANASSGTAASVVSNTRTGEGAIYQTIFFPTKTDSTDDTNTITWAGQVHALLVDSTGNMREDSNQNQKLDVEGPDLNGDGVAYHEDLNMNNVLDTEDTNGNGELDDGEDLNGNGELDTEDADGDGVLDCESETGECIIATDPADHPFMKELDAILVFEDTKAHLYYDVDGDEEISDVEELYNAGSSDVDSDDVNYLWNSSDWLNSDELAVTTQRTSYISDSYARYIFTWVDGDANDLIDDGEILDFVWPSTDPDVSELSKTTTDEDPKFYPYLHLYSSFEDRPDAISELIEDDEDNDTDYFEEFLLRQTEREINWIRGLDDVDDSGTPELLSLFDDDDTDDNEVDVAGTEMRSRKYDGKTWRLGDIAYSTPTVVGVPEENYHLLYSDTTYATFYSRYQTRRNVIYAGANDGMIHAFNGGFYDEDNTQFCKELNEDYDLTDDDDTNDEVCSDDTTMPELGAELWAYVPFNLLPHLFWLTETGYEHSYYVDLKPRIFDAKIFTAENACTSDALSDDCIHPEGWGTIMVVGMRLGGSTIVADVDKTDGDEETDDDITMKSSYMIFDITNPETAPTLLGEITMPNMGYAFSYPTLAIMKDGDHDGSFEDYNSTTPDLGENRWFLAFGSGPADEDGNPDSSILDTVESFQNGHYYLLDLVKLASEGTLYSLAEGGELTVGLNSYVELEEDSFVDSSVSVDYDLDFNADAVYFGTVSGHYEDDVYDYGGMMRRIVIDDLNDPTNWVADSVLFDADRPISAMASIAEDSAGDNWIFFGTGRYYVNSDNDDVSLQSYYGLKEPVDDDDYKTWDPISSDRLSLMDTTDIEVYTSSLVYVDGELEDWEYLASEQADLDGWYVDLMESGERNLGQATLVGGLLTFTTFVPSDDPCVASGTSYLWALYYATGTPYYTGVLGTETTTTDGTTYSRALSKMSLGEGLASTPNIHVGSESGSTVYVQLSTGEILEISQENPETTKSAFQAWKRR